ncbi:MAG: hypothetical protein AAF215_03285 [Cyanobacteria bacterium P01_A01_bin.123]
MPLQKFPVTAAQKVSVYIKTHLALPVSEQFPKSPAQTVDEDSSEEIPEPSSLGELGDLFRLGSLPEDDVPAPNTEGRWFISTIDPAAVIAKLPGLFLKPETQLVTYLFRKGSLGTGITWALPEHLSTTACLEQAITQAKGYDIPPHPEGAFESMMAAIDGDGSPTSFLAASILSRELQELGRTGKFTRWAHHRLINQIPPQRQWQWRTSPPKDFSPKVKTLPNQQVAVEFFTCRVTPPIGIFRHVDQYSPQQYQPQAADRVIASTGT